MIGLTPTELKEGIGLSKSTSYMLLDKLEKSQSKLINSDNEKEKGFIKKILPAHSIRKILEGRNFSYPQFNISFQVVKGGAGKTTLATNFSYRCSQYGVRVLLIDF